MALPAGGSAGGGGLGGPAGESFDAVDVIIAKRDGQRLSGAMIDWVIDAYTRGVVAEEQMAALAMAIVLNGMDRAEIAAWTSAMVRTGQRLSFRNLAAPTVDKHSTGGVGDKITLPLGPLVASYGVAVPQLSGRGLGHTGGTLDKLESVAGWRAALSTQEMMDQLAAVGAVVCQAGSGLAPADRKLYALRDVTGTVESIPLIASSIMSKKIAEGTAALVLDVKCGSGAFMKDQARAAELARTMVALGHDAAVDTVALVTDMSTPLGLTVGNALEVREALEVLAGGGPPDVVELTCALAREMLAAAARQVAAAPGQAARVEAGRLLEADPLESLANGRAMDKWRAMVAAQGGDPDAPLPVAREAQTVLAPRGGRLTRLDALAVGVAAWRLGAGRSRKEDPVQAGAGIELHAKPGDLVAPGQPLMTLWTDTPERFARALEALEGAFAVEPAGDNPPVENSPGSGPGVGPQPDYRYLGPEGKALESCPPRAIVLERISLEGDRP
ncbi:MAG: thymidine phosphorylase [Bifidobacteriaceae bacterium]|jgi:thymidine phosphorylase|nr:thymidine phosphorylase [Bifidobacteriaceae bacterium]